MTKAMTLRPPDGLHAKLAKMAARHRRSLHAKILVALDQYIEIQEGGLSLKRCLTNQGDFFAICQGRTPSPKLR